MADARIVIELKADDAKRKLKEYEREKATAEKKAARAEDKEAKEKGEEEKEESKRDRAVKTLTNVNWALRSPTAVLSSAAMKGLGGDDGGIAKAIEIATLAYDTAQAANSATLVLGGVLKEQDSAIAKLIGEELVAGSEAIQKAVFDKAGQLMGAARITAQTKVSFARARIYLRPDAMAEIAIFAFAEGGRKAQIETRERQLIGREVGRIIKELTGWGG